MLKGDTGENLIGLLERRLDAVIYRAKFATTVFSSRQLINHGHVKVNGKKVNIGSYIVKKKILQRLEINLSNQQLQILLLQAKREKLQNIFKWMRKTKKLNL